MLWLMKLKRLLSLLLPSTARSPPQQPCAPPTGIPCGQTCVCKWNAFALELPYYHTPPVVSHFTWQQPFGKKMLLIWLDNLFSHINSGPTRANEKCVINVRRLNASRMCSSSSASASAPRRGPDNYYPAALKDMRAQISDTYLLIYLFIHIYGTYSMYYTS